MEVSERHFGGPCHSGPLGLEVEPGRGGFSRRAVFHSGDGDADSDGDPVLEDS